MKAKLKTKRTLILSLLLAAFSIPIYATGQTDDRGSIDSLSKYLKGDAKMYIERPEDFPALKYTRPTAD